VQSLAVCAGNIFAGTQIYGIYLSVDDGTSWMPINYGLGGYPSLSLNIYSLGINNSYIFAGTGNGLWRRSLSEITNIKGESPILTNEYKLKQNYPNPFNSTTSINYQLSENAEVAINVYNIYGQQIRTLVHIRQKAGEYLVTFDAKELPSGIYFYRLMVNSYAITRKMMLIR